jgi:hypothetical protein
VDNDKVNRVLDDVITTLGEEGVPEMRLEGAKRLPNGELALSHVLWMAREARTFPPNKLEKKMRWLGFIQGVLWVAHGESIDELKRANMPDVVP